MRLHYTVLITSTILLAYSQFKAKLYHVQPDEHNMLGHCEKTDGENIQSLHHDWNYCITAEGKQKQTCQ